MHNLPVSMHGILFARNTASVCHTCDFAAMELSHVQIWPTIRCASSVVETGGCVNHLHSYIQVMCFVCMLHMRILSLKYTQACMCAVARQVCEVVTDHHMFSQLLELGIMLISTDAIFRVQLYEQSHRYVKPHRKRSAVPCIGCAQKTTAAGLDAVQVTPRKQLQAHLSV